jgi:hypothetical protein
MPPRAWSAAAARRGALGTVRPTGGRRPALRAAARRPVGRCPPFGAAAPRRDEPHTGAKCGAGGLAEDDPMVQGLLLHRLHPPLRHRVPVRRRVAPLASPSALRPRPPRRTRPRCPVILPHDQGLGHSKTARARAELLTAVCLANFCTIRLTSWRARAAGGASRSSIDRDSTHSHPAESFTGGYATSLCPLTASQKDIDALLYERGADFGKDFEERYVRGAVRVEESTADTRVYASAQAPSYPFARSGRGLACGWCLSALAPRLSPRYIPRPWTSWKCRRCPRAPR